MAFYSDQIIDVDDLVREQIELALPMSRLCSDDCRGLCPECGANLNEGDCACARDQRGSEMGRAQPVESLDLKV